MPAAAALRRCIGPPLRDTFAELLGGTDAGLVEQAVGLYRERYVPAGMLENEVYPGVREALPALQREGHRLWVVTAKPHVYARQIVAHFGLQDGFAGVHGSELDGARSDKGELIAHVLRTEGMAAVGVLWGYGSEQELRDAGPAHLVASMAELCALVRLEA